MRDSQQETGRKAGRPRPLTGWDGRNDQRGELVDGGFRAFPAQAATLRFLALLVRFCARPEQPAAPTPSGKPRSHRQLPLGSLVRLTAQ